MAFLRINGWTVPVFDATPVRKHDRQGRRGRSFRGQARDARRHVRRSWRCRACFLDHGDAVALERLLLGEGHLIDFARGVEASTSLMPAPGYGQSVRLLPSSWGAYGRGLASIDDAATGTILAYDAQVGDDWTVLVRRLDGASQEFIGYAQRSDGTSYVDGAASATFGMPSTAGGEAFRFVVRGGVVELVKDGSASSEQIDDLVILPWVATDGQLAAWTSRTADVPKWGQMPVLRVDGNMVDEGGRTRLAVGAVTGIDIVQGLSRIDGLGWVNNARVVSFTLDEVDPICVREIEDDEQETPVPPGAPIAWYDAGNIDGRRNAETAQGATVGDWYDRGSRSENIGSAGTNRPTLQMIPTTTRLKNGPAVRFDGVNDYMATSAAAPNVVSPVTIAVVWRTTTVAAGTAYVLDRASGAGFRARLYRSGSVHTIGSEATTATHATALVAGEWNASLAVLQAADSEHRLNGVIEAESADLSDASGTSGFTLGAVDGGASSWLAGDVAEVLIWEGAVDLDDVQAYLDAKHGGFPG